MSLRQHCVCETCGKVFLDVDALEYLKLHHFVEPITLSVADIPIDELVANASFEVSCRMRKFDKWYVKAIQHWIDNPTHDLIVSAPFQYVKNSPINRINIVAQHKIMFDMFGTRYLQAQQYCINQAWEESFPI